MVPDSVKDYVSYDAETGVMMWTKTSKATKGSHSEGYHRISFEGKRYFVHKLAYWWVYGDYPRKVDHKDGKVSNNRITNLRIATDRQNSLNRKSSGRSEFLGVYYHKKNDKWCSSITPTKGVKEFIGSFTSELEAALAYNYKAKEVHGDFARLNKVF